MATKVTRANRVAKQRVRSSGPARAKAHDAKLLARAEVETQEGIEPRGSRTVVIDAAEFESVCLQLKELTHVAVDAWATRDGFAGGIEAVLVKLHAARLNLQSAAGVLP